MDKDLPSGSKRVYVTWPVPTTNCPGEKLESVEPAGMESGGGAFGIGQHNVIYKYSSSSGTLSCPVEITVKGKISIKTLIKAIVLRSVVIIFL